VEGIIRQGPEAGKEESAEMRVEESVEINRPLEEVYSYAANPEHYPEWSGIILEVQKEGPGELAEGERFTTISKFLGRTFETPFEVTAHEPNRLHSHRSTGGPLPQEYTSTFEETAGGGTRMTQAVEGEPGGFFRLAGPLLEAAGRRQFKADLETLKDLLEA
jgi:uncharacterized membrane protein